MGAEFAQINSCNQSIGSEHMQWCSFSRDFPTIICQITLGFKELSRDAHFVFALTISLI